MDDDFVEELERARREWALVPGGAESRWNALWRRRIVEWVRKQQALGKVVPELAERRTTSPRPPVSAQAGPG